MADLDDFFAKKDRKKSKSVKKFATAEELAKKLEDTSKKSEIKPRKDRLTQLNADNEDVVNQEPEKEDEWKEFEEDEGQKDYSNLKIGQLTISQEEQNQVNDGVEPGSGGESDGEGNSDNSDRSSGPWKKVAGDEASGEQSQVASVIQQGAGPGQKSYVSPAFRNQSSQARPGAKAKNRIAPDLSNQEYFPSLEAATKQELLAKKKIDANFEEVKHGGRAQKTSDLPANAPVTVGNRFKTLDDN